MRPRFAFPVPRPTGPVIDGLDIREFHLRIPPDAPPGITVRWVWTANGQGIGLPEEMALAAADLGDVIGLEAALVAWLAACLTAQKRMPADAVATTSAPVVPPVAAPELSMGTLR